MVPSYKKALDFEATERKKRNNQRLLGKKRVEAHVQKIGLRKKDAPCQKKCRLGVKTVKEDEMSPATYVDRYNTG